jgi:hypothetical protein
VLVDPVTKLVLVQTALRDNFQRGELLTMFETLATKLN